MLYATILPKKSTGHWLALTFHAETWTLLSYRRLYDTHSVSEAKPPGMSNTEAQTHPPSLTTSSDLRQAMWWVNAHFTAPGLRCFLGPSAFGHNGLNLMCQTFRCLLRMRDMGWELSLFNFFQILKSLINEEIIYVQLFQILLPLRHIATYGSFYWHTSKSVPTQKSLKIYA